MAIHSSILAWKIPWTEEDNLKEEKNLDSGSKPGGRGWYSEVPLGHPEPCLGGVASYCPGLGRGLPRATPHSDRGQGRRTYTSAAHCILHRASEGDPGESRPLWAAKRVGLGGHFSFCAGHCPYLCHP